MSMDLSKKEIEIILKLRDEASQKIQSFRANIKEFNSATKDSLQPLLLLRQAWMKTGLAAGFLFGAIYKGLQGLDKYRQEIDQLDQSSIKLGVTTEALSKKIYGYNIASANARIGSSWGSFLLEALGYAGKFYGGKVAEGVGATAKFNRAIGLYGSMTVGRENTYTGEQKQELWSRANEIAENQLLAREEARKTRSKEALQLNIEYTQKIKQLDLSGYEYKKYLLTEEVALAKAAGADKIQVANYEAAYCKRLEEDRTIALKTQQANRLKAEGQTLDALKLEQDNALVEFKRQFGGDGEMVQEFIKGQQAIYQEAKLNYWGLKNEFQIWHGGMVSIIGSLQSEFGGFYDTTTGMFRDLGDVATDFGKSILSVINQMIAQFLVAKAILGIQSLFSGSTIVGGVGGTTTQTTQFGTVWSPYHKGRIVRAHQGLAVDEVPIIAQTGERVLSRSQNRQLGSSGGSPGQRNEGDI